MNKIPAYLLEKFQLLGMVTFTILFAISFLNLYTPFSETVWFTFEGTTKFLFTSGFLAISILFIILSKLLLYKIAKNHSINYIQYILWWIIEVLIISLFYTYVTIDLVKDIAISEFKIFSKALFVSTVSIIFPYIISAMYFAIIDKNKTIKLMRFSSIQTDENTQESKEIESHISLFDNSGVLKLSIKSSDLFYIESDDNYIKVWYKDNSSELKMYMLRCKLKTIEESFKESSLMRCHRKYIVNKEKVKILRKEGDKYFIDLDYDGIDPIVVTKTYQSTLIKAFSNPSSATKPTE